MKKLVGMICALVMVFSMALTAFAKPSPEGGNIEAFDADGNQIEIIKIEESEVTDSEECDHGDNCPGRIEIVTPATEKYQDEIADIDLEALIKGTEYEGKEWVKVFEIEVIVKGCVQLPVTLTFDADDWLEGNPIVVHYSTSEKAWELVEVNEDNGKFKATFTHFSPLVFYTEKSVEAEKDETPKTGDPATMAYAVVAAGSLGVAVLSRKKRK